MPAQADVDWVVYTDASDVALSVVLTDECVEDRCWLSKVEEGR